MRSLSNIFKRKENCQRSFNDEEPNKSICIVNYAEIMRVSMYSTFLNNRNEGNRVFEYVLMYQLLNVFIENSYRNFRKL